MPRKDKPAYEATRSLDRQAQDLARREGIPLTDAYLIIVGKEPERSENAEEPCS